MTHQHKHPNHDLSPMKCPVSLDDVDLFGPGAQEHWYEAYPILHEHAPVLKLAGEGVMPGTDAYVLTKYEDISRVVKDPVRYPALLSLGLEDAVKKAQENPDEKNFVNAMQVSMATLRPTVELWRAHRQELTDPWVGPGASRHTQMITDLANGLIDKWIDKGECDFVADFARPLPQMVMANVLGFPLSDLKLLEKWGTAQVKQFVFGRTHKNILNQQEIAEQFEVLDGFAEYVDDKIKARRAEPQDDMITFLTQVEYKALGRKLTDAEINGIVYAMVIGGLETTQYALEEQAQILCENPDLFKRIKNDRSLIRGFTEEIMRLRSPTQGLSTRITTQEEDFQGVKVPPGSQIHLRFGAGNVDPEEWECPYEVNIERKAITRHLTFSQGPRICPGAGISRVEQQTAWEILFERLDGIDYAPGNLFIHQPGIMLGTLELHVKVKKA